MQECADMKRDYWLIVIALGWGVVYIESYFTGWMHYRMEYWEQQLIAISWGIVIGRAAQVWLRH